MPEINDQITSKAKKYSIYLTGFARFLLIRNSRYDSTILPGFYGKSFLLTQKKSLAAGVLSWSITKFSVGPQTTPGSGIQDPTPQNNDRTSRLNARNYKMVT
jgi:hypothetical protein